MAQLAFGLVGAGLAGAIAPAGFTFLGMSAASIGWSIGTFIGGLILAPDAPVIEGPRLSDLRVQTASFGEPITDVYGTFGISGNLIWAKDIEEVRTKSGGGKGLGGGATSITYTYFGHFAVAFATPITGITRMWADSKLFYDKTELNEGPVTKFDSAITIYLGDENQLPDSSIEADKGVGLVPAHRGIAYVVFNRLPLADFSNHVPNITAEVTNSLSDEKPVVRALVETVTTVGQNLFKTTNNERVGWNTASSLLMKVDLVGKQQLQVIDTSFAAPISGVYTDVSEDGIFFGIRSGDPNSFASRLVRLDPPGYINNLMGDNVGHVAGPAMAVFHQKIAGLNHIWVSFRKSNGTPDRVITYLAEPNTSNNPLRPQDMRHTGSFSPQNHDIINSGGGIQMSPDGDGKSVWIWGFDAGTPAIIVVRLDINADLVEKHIIPWPEATTPTHLFYDPGTNSFIGLSVGGTYSFRITKDGNFFRTSGTTGQPVTNDARHHAMIRRSRVQKGHIWYMGVSNVVHQVRVSDMVVANDYDLDDWGGATSWDTTYHINDDAIITQDTAGGSGGNIGFFFLNRGSGGSVSLKSIVDDRLDKAAIDLATQTDTSAIAPIQVQGYAVSSRMPGRSTLEPLVKAFRWDLIETDHILKAVRRGGVPVAILTRADLAATEDDSDPPPFVSQPRIQEIDLPFRIDWRYIDKASDYEIGLQFAQRIQEAVSTVKQVTLDLSIVMTADEAKQAVEIALFAMWQERDAFEIFTGPKWLKLDPADVITLEDDNFTRRVLLKLSEYGNNGIVRLNSVADDDEVYQSDAIGDDIGGGGDHDINFPAITTMLLLDTPLLRDEDTADGLYILAGAADEGWDGSVIYKSIDGTSYVQLIAVLSDRNAQMGFSTTLLGDGVTTVFDEVNTVTVTINRGTLESKTELEVLNGANAAILGNEIFQYKTAVQSTASTWILSGLLRGRRGTEHETANHIKGDSFAVLITGRISRIVPGDAGPIRFYRAVTIGDIFDDFSADQSFRNTNKGLMPYSAVSITGVRDGSSNLTIDWKRRTRIGGKWKDFVDVPLSETGENYEIDIIDNSESPSVVVRTIITTTTVASYTRADEITDFGSDPPGLIDIEIYQLSEEVGRGFPGKATI